MHLLLLNTFIAFLFSTPTLAAPSPSKTAHLYVCNNESFIGPCSNLWVPVSQCHPLSAPYAKAVSSAGPDAGTFCTLYSEADCSGEALPFTNPGIRSLKRYGFDDVAQSVRCDFITGWKSHA